MSVDILVEVVFPMLHFVDKVKCKYLNKEVYRRLGKKINKLQKLSDPDEIIEHVNGKTIRDPRDVYLILSSRIHYNEINVTFKVDKEELIKYLFHSHITHVVLNGIDGPSAFYFLDRLGILKLYCQLANIWNIDSIEMLIRKFDDTSVVRDVISMEKALHPCFDETYNTGYCADDFKKILKFAKKYSCNAGIRYKCLPTHLPTDTDDPYIL